MQTLVEKLNALTDKIFAIEKRLTFIRIRAKILIDKKDKMDKELFFVLFSDKVLAGIQSLVNRLNEISIEINHIKQASASRIEELCEKEEDELENEGLGLIFAQLKFEESRDLVDIISRISKNAMRT